MKWYILCALLLAAVAAGAARAEGERPLPWEGGATVETEAERLFGQAASEIAGRPVQVRCNGETDWAQLLAQRGLGGSPGGYTRFGENFTELSPRVCSFLDRYAYTNPKPSYWCKGTKTVTQLVQRRYRSREGKPLLKNGKPVLRKGKPVYVWKTHFEVRHVPVQRVREIDVKCPGADEWGWYSYSLGMLAHESYHLGGIRDEAQTECYGLQAVARTAVSLGATLPEAKIAADYAWTTLYPALEDKEPGYWSPECRSGGAFDLTPGDGVWP